MDKAMLHLEILPKTQKELFFMLSDSKLVAPFYLAGGTALALQIGHRKSIDFDFFTEEDFDVQAIKKMLVEAGDFELFSESSGTIHGQLNKVQVSFFVLPYPLLECSCKSNYLSIASKKDIAVMKLAAISSRGSKKDFMDLYFLLREYSFEEMFSAFVDKYGEKEENIYCVLKGLTYFDDAEAQPMPKMIKRTLWREVKKTITSEQKKYIASL
jgi:predicted nucleotidyltransferase component of viral defense system